jgi:uncharacterized delta-60 repeat protein
MTIAGATGEYYEAASLLEQADGRLLVIGTRDSAGLTSPVLWRLNADGSLDSSFGNGGLTTVVVPGVALGLSQTRAAVLQPDGKIVITGSKELNVNKGVFWVFVARVNTDGTPDVTFGDSGGVAVTPFTDAPQQYSNFGGGVAVWVRPGGKLLVAGVQNRAADLSGLFALLQLDSNGRVDPTFGVNGRQALPAGGLLSHASAAWDGTHVLFASTVLPPIPPGGGVEPDSTIVVRMNADGSADSSFGNCGRVQLPRIPPTPDAVANSAFSAFAIALQPDGKLILGGAYVTVVPGGAGAAAFAISRLLGGTSTASLLMSSDNPASTGQAVTLHATIVGSLPPSGAVSFNEGGTALDGCDAVPVAVIGLPVPHYGALCQANNLSVGTHSLSATYSGDASNAPATSCVLNQFIDPPAEASAIEYYHDVFDHYFLTTLPSEVAALDAGVFPGWRQSGQHFHVFPLGQPGAAPVCRFFSGQTFAPKSSHFYTPIPSECNAVQQSAVWLFEGIVFGLNLPSAAGTCGAGSQPLYRLYNNGQGGAPNHRYLTDFVTRNTMIQDYGWIPEGSGIGVIGCVPTD